MARRIVQMFVSKPNKPVIQKEAKPVQPAVLIGVQWTNAVGAAANHWIKKYHPSIHLDEFKRTVIHNLRRDYPREMTVAANLTAADRTINEVYYTPRTAGHHAGGIFLEAGFNSGAVQHLLNLARARQTQPA
jgi:hypothetical protein